MVSRIKTKWAPKIKAILCKLKKNEPNWNKPNKNIDKKKIIEKNNNQKKRKRKLKKKSQFFSESQQVEI